MLLLYLARERRTLLLGSPGHRQPALARWLGEIGGEILGRVRASITVSVQLP